MSEPNQDLETWGDIRDRAFCVVLLTRRKDDLWSLPVSVADLHSYAPPGTLEEEIRSRGEFGNGSITVSCNALLALSAATGGRRPLPSAAVLGRIEEHRGQRGGYGSFSPGKDGRQINSIPRHTAMGVVTHLLFPTPPWQTSNPAHLGESVKWLLDNRERGGGWSHSRDTRPALGFLSTASSLCALSLYMELGVASGRVVASIKAALSAGFSALARAQRNGIWSGDGVPPEFHALDSAWALRLLRIADRSGALSSSIPPGEPSLCHLISTYAANVLRDSPFPYSGSAQARVTTHIAALQLVVEVAQSGVPATALDGAKRSILSSWNSGELPWLMTGWDWQCLTILASIEAGPIAADKAGRLEGACASIRAAWMSGKLRRGDLAALDSRLEKPVAFALTGGRGFNPLWKDYAKDLPKILLDKMLDNIIAWVFAAALALVSIIILRYAS